ncbi:SDR family oxidoreductase [Actinospica sp. MGRD01-02]|uniref:SDR family oxidoreductase n=1 Tax=Actinospica acidithermotolerans TaxID=2828514 RepID=A0A941IJ96_9ACTN|nr:SDR family oxidoreductase [Actinospica acidithermotolerans]MBR7826918.1 SDR family oxidoreductase [Actinospica acidithermotolerans]
MSNPAARAPLAGKTAVVTGAARGIGASLALSLVRRGANVALVGLEPYELEQAAKICREHAAANAGAAVWEADVTDKARMAEVATEVSDHFGAIDIVVANAGIAIGGPFADSDPATFDRVIEVNLLGSIATARAMLPALTRSRGYLLQVASLAALTPTPLMAAYCTSKSGVEAFAHSLRSEVRPDGVDIGVAYLSWTDTDMVRGADKDTVLAEMRSRLPWPANKTGELEAAVERLTQGIVRRSAHVYGQAWVRGMQWLPRGVLPAAIAFRGAKEVKRLSPRLAAGADQRRRPVGPGGLAALRDKAGSAAEE